MDNIQEQQQKKRIKSIKNAENDTFTCRLFYFVMLCATLGLLYQFDNTLKHEKYSFSLYLIQATIAAYTIMTAGSNPGYIIKQINDSDGIQQRTPIAPISKPNDQYCIQNELPNDFCKICIVRMKNRTKHCYRCGKCVMKYDHHCPWTGACVGQFNHCRFIVMLLFQLIQAIFNFSIFFRSLEYYEYKDQNGIYITEFGAFSIFALFMFFYAIAISGLLSFHVYLIMANITTKQLLSRGKLNYLKNVKGNPFSKGVWNNIKMTIFPEKGGNQWKIESCQNQQKRTCLQKCWSNKYYDCC